MRVIVAHPNAQHSHRLALAIQRAGWLEAYVTQLYYNRCRWPFSLVCLLPRQIQARIDDLLFRRHLEGLDPDRVTTSGLWAELAFVLLNRLGMAKNLRERWLFYTSRRFSGRVGCLAAMNADMVIGTDGASLDAFRIAKQAGVTCVLDLSHPHVLTCLRIEQEERELAPEFSKTFDSFAMDSSDIDYHVAEVQEADAVIVASTFAKESLVENDIDLKRVHVVPYGVDTKRFHPPEQAVASNGVSNDRLRVLFVGRAGQRKGIGYLLQAVHELRKTHNVSLTVVGNLWGDALAFEPYAEDYVHLGRVPDSIFPQVYHQADVFVLPSLIEGFGLVILEAMAAGLPVIVTQNTGGRDLVEDGVEGFIIPIRNVKVLQERLIYLSENPNVRRQMGQAARRKAERYPWERYYQGIAETVQEIHRGRMPL